jgi:6-phosphogluconate dehydrogenase
MSQPTADIGLIGLAVMGENLVLNMESHGYTVAVFNRTTSKVDDFVGGRGLGKKLVGCHSVKDLVAALKRPRKVMIMVKAGGAVDAVLDELAPLLEPGDILIDGGNTHYPDTTRRTRALKDKGLLFVGTGVSGGEEGALKGPSIMPGGNPDAWESVKPIFQAIAAKVGDGTPCCDWVGNEGAGHYVKMVHNGIEYGDIQLICEAYHLMKNLVGLDAPKLHEVFARWNTGALDSYLIEITRDIFGFKDEETGQPMVDLILDKAGQKGTGKWTVTSALDLGIPLTLIGESVFARCLSAQKDERVEAEKILSGPTSKFEGDPAAFIEDVEMALYASKIISYAQGYALMNAMAKDSGWEINNGGVALMWRGGCIIRPQPEARQPLARPVLHRRDQPSPGRLATGRRGGLDARDSRPVHGCGPVLLRRLSNRPSALQPSSGPARLLRRSHLRTNRQAPRRVLPHQLDRPGRHDGFDHL